MSMKLAKTLFPFGLRRFIAYGLCYTAYFIVLISARICPEDFEEVLETWEKKNEFERN